MEGSNGSSISHRKFSNKLCIITDKLNMFYILEKVLAIFKTQTNTSTPENENTNLYKMAICNWNKMILTTTYALHKLKGVAHDTHGQHNSEKASEPSDIQVTADDDIAKTQVYYN